LLTDPETEQANPQESIKKTYSKYVVGPVVKPVAGD
jgi:hypothetical protein